MSAISFKLPDDLLEASKRCAVVLKLLRAAYVCRAVERMNRETQACLPARRLADASRRVRAESMKVNAEFAEVLEPVDGELAPLLTA